jgi:cob(I)alamin adenosyltransferase
MGSCLPFNPRTVHHVKILKYRDRMDSLKQELEKLERDLNDVQEDPSNPIAREILTIKRINIRRLRDRIAKTKYKIDEMTKT